MSLSQSPLTPSKDSTRFIRVLRDLIEQAARPSERFVGYGHTPTAHWSNRYILEVVVLFSLCTSEG